MSMSDNTPNPNSQQDNGRRHKTMNKKQLKVWFLRVFRANGNAVYAFR